MNNFLLVNPTNCWMFGKLWAITNDRFRCPLTTGLILGLESDMSTTESAPLFGNMVMQYGIVDLSNSGKKIFFICSTSNHHLDQYWHIFHSNTYWDMKKECLSNHRLQGNLQVLVKWDAVTLYQFNDKNQHASYDSFDLTDKIMKVCH